MDISGTKIEAAIFDLDGTLADSMNVWGHIDAEFFDSHGIAMPSDYKAAICSMGFPQAAAYTKRRFCLAETVDEIIAQWLALARHEYADNIQLKKGAGEFLTALHLHGVKLGLATASGSELFEPLLKRHGVYGYFDAFVTTAQAGRDKNYPDVYLLCAKYLCCEPCRCMVFEDLLPGVLTAKSVGMKVTGVFDASSLSAQQKIESSADFYIKDFKDALRALL